MHYNDFQYENQQSRLWKSMMSCKNTRRYDFVKKKQIICLRLSIFLHSFFF